MSPRRGSDKADSDSAADVVETDDEAEMGIAQKCAGGGGCDVWGTKDRSKEHQTHKEVEDKQTNRLKR